LAKTNHVNFCLPLVFPLSDFFRGLGGACAPLAQ